MFILSQHLLPVEGSSELAKEFPGVVSLLRFLRKSGRLSEIDKFASAPDADSAIEVLKDALSTIYRSAREVEGRWICHYEEIGSEEDRKRYEFLCGRECIRGNRVLVPCPKLPTDGELERLREGIRSGRVRPGHLAALALAKGGRGGRGA